jgi:hypothetical protein
MAYSLSPNGNSRQLQSWAMPVEAALDLLQIQPQDRGAARARLAGRGLLIEGVLDLADPRVAEVLKLPVTRGRKALAQAQADERQAAAERARRNIARRNGVIYGC